MKLSFKHLLAVGALAVASGSAFADAVVPVGPYSATTPSGDNGGLLFGLYSDNPDTAFSMTYYLGLNLNDVIPTEMDQGGLSLSWSIPGLNQIPGTVATSSLRWGTFAADAGSTNIAGSIRFATTVAAGSDVATTTSSSLNNIANFTNATLIPNNNAVNSSPLDVVVSAADPSYLTTNTGAFASLSGFGQLTETLAMYLFTNTGRGTSTINAATQYAGTWAFDLANGTLNYNVSAVPLPAALWLLLSGIGGLGIIGRRRGAAALPA